MTAPVYGLTPQGFLVKPLDQCVADNIARLQSTFGSDIDVSPDSFFGLLAATMSKPESDVWQQAGAVYASRSRQSAEGVSLDTIASYVFLTREQPLASSAIAYLGGANATLVPAGTQFSLPNGAVFATTQDVTLSNPGGNSSVMQQVTITAQLLAGTNSIALTGTGGSYTASADANQTFAAIATALVNAINAQVSILGVTASAIGPVITLIANNTGSPFRLTGVAGNLSASPAFNNTVFCSCTVTGPTAAPIGTLTTIVTPVSGLSAVTNLAAANLGQDLESDLALRQRIVTAPGRGGKATENAIAALVLLDTAIYGMEGVFVISNRGDTNDTAGRPPHSFEVYVQGVFNPTDTATLNAIAQAILDSEPAGIQPVSTGSGDETLQGTATDQNGNAVTVPFSLPRQKWVWLWVDLTANTEETFPTNGTAVVQSALAAFGATAVISEDIVLQKYFTPIYSTAGILLAAIYAVTTDPNPGSPPSKPDSEAVQADFTSPAGTYAIPTGAIAVYDASRIVVTKS